MNSKSRAIELLERENAELRGDLNSQQEVYSRFFVRRVAQYGDDFRRDFKEFQLDKLCKDFPLEKIEELAKEYKKKVEKNKLQAKTAISRLRKILIEFETYSKTE